MKSQKTIKQLNEEFNKWTEKVNKELASDFGLYNE